MFMPTPWRASHLPDLVAHLAGRPGHEAVRTDVAELLRNVFSTDYAALDHEMRLPEVRGRADMLLGATVFEFKRDLRQETGDVLARLPDYLKAYERRTGRRYLGIATDGATSRRLRTARRRDQRDRPARGQGGRPRRAPRVARPGARHPRRTGPDPAGLSPRTRPGEPDLRPGRGRAGAPLGRAAGRTRGRLEAPALGRAVARGLRHAGRRRRPVLAAHLPHRRRQGPGAPRARPARQRRARPALRPGAGRSRHLRRGRGRLLRLGAGRPGRGRPRRPPRPAGGALSPARRRGGRLEGRLREPDRPASAQGIWASTTRPTGWRRG